MDKVKRERSTNFTLRERDLLVSLVVKYQDILENKQSDATTWKKKEAAWEMITKEFNGRGGVFRNTKTLKIKYEGLKRTVRKKSAVIRAELYRTGGGTNTAPPLDNAEEQIKSMITLTTDGHESLYDSDVLPQTQESQDSMDVSIMNPIMEELMTITPLPVDSEIKVVESDTTEYEVLQIVSSECEPLPGQSTKPEEIFNLNNALDSTSVGECVPTPTTSINKKWDVTSRRNLKSRKHPALAGNVHKRVLFDELTETKLELVKLQKKFLEAEIKEKELVWEFEKNERRKEADFKEKERYWKEKEHKWKEEEQTLILEKLRKELKQ